MQLEGKLSFALEGARQLLELLSVEDYIGIVTFSDTAVVTSPVRLATPNNRQAAVASLASIAARGSTNMIDALNLAISQLKSTSLPADQTFTKRVILLSDGQPDSEAGLTAIAQSERNNDITLVCD
jgi:uncharacterized protein YegL